VNVHAPQSLSPGDCQALIRGGGIGRVGVSVDALPAIFPVRFALLDDGIVFRTGSETLSVDAVTNAIVAFETDSVDDLGDGWSVLVVGRAAAIEDAAALEAARQLPLAPLSSSDGDHFICIPAERISGWAFTTSGSHAPATRL
jgi:nitroimidazol reductase NimA-like FMN-containing flavoprotein (pyridoxamine 5'-phosphate oxidase superfamily)